MISRITSGYGFQSSAASNSVDCTGGNFIICAIGTYSTVPQYGGVELTESHGFYYMFNPPQGAHNLTVGTSNSPHRAVSWAVYSGVKSSGFPDSYGSGSTPNNANFSYSNTTVAEDCWVLALYPTEGDGASLVSGLTQFVAPYFTGFNTFGGLADTDAAVASGGHTITIDPISSSGAASYSIGFAPEPLPTVITLAITDFGPISITGNGTVDNGGTSTVTERGVVVGTSINPTTSNMKFTTSGTTGTFSVSATGLTGATIYHMRAFATNSSGTAYGEDVYFITRSAFYLSISPMSLTMTFWDILLRTVQFTNTSKPSTSITNSSKPSTTITNSSKPTTSFVNNNKPIL
jgi:hypothetical protein